jgi:VCBS repeat-containing protein
MAISIANQAIGKVFILHGTVKAVAADGTVRMLEPNSLVYAHERIVTESDGNVSIMLDGPPPSQIDLGRMSDVLLNEDVYAGVTPEVVKDASAEAADAEKIQEALEGEGEIELDATAAGLSGAGGGVTLVKFDAEGNEISPESGVETTGVGFSQPDGLQGVVLAQTAGIPGDPGQQDDSGQQDDPIGVVAFDNFNSAGFTLKAVPGEKTEISLVFDAGNAQTVGQGNDFGRTAREAGDVWGITDNARVAGNEGILEIEDRAPAAESWTAVSTPFISVAEGATGTVSFTGNVINFNEGDVFTWQLYGQIGGEWQLAESGTETSGGENGFFEVTVSPLDAGTYRLVFVVNDGSVEQGNPEWYTVAIDQIAVTETAPETFEVQVIPTEGNVILDPNAWVDSDDPQDAVDENAEGATLRILDPNTGEFLDVVDGTAIAGDFGTLTINSDGSYTYTPDPGTFGDGFEGGTETFTYQLVLGDTSDTAMLVIEVGFVENSGETEQIQMTMFASVDESGGDLSFDGTGDDLGPLVGDPEDGATGG